MPQTIQAGTILIEDHPLIAEHLAIESTPSATNWSMVEGGNGVTLDRKIHAAGWNFFFFPGPVKAMFFGEPHAKNIRNAVKRILAKVRGQDFNCLEVVAIVSKRFAGVSYTVVSGHRRHIQQGWRLDHAEQRQAENKSAEWARR
jgi:hypothetical protein